MQVNVISAKHFLGRGERQRQRQRERRQERGLPSSFYPLFQNSSTAVEPSFPGLRPKTLSSAHRRFEKLARAAPKNNSQSCVATFNITSTLLHVVDTIPL